MSARPTGLPSAYWRQWTASAISNLGDGVNFVAMPLLALTLTSDERLLSLTTFATFIPWILLALPVGVIVDRADRRLLMVTSNAIRVVLFGGIAYGAVNDHLSIWLLLALLVVIGSCEVAFDSSAQAFLPMLVEPTDLPRANGFLFAAEIVAGSLAGLAIGAFLFSASVGLPFGLNAVSFAIAAILIMFVRPRSGAGAAMGMGAPLDRRLAVGVRWLREHRLLRTLAAMFTITNLGLMFAQGIFVKYAIVELGLSNIEYGILLAITAMGAAFGGLVADRVIRRLGVRTSIVIPYLVFGVAQVVIGLASRAWIVGIAGFSLGGAITTWNVVTVSVRQQVIPADLFGRVNGIYRLLGAGASAAGVALGGIVAYETNLRMPFIVGGGITLLAAVLFARPVIAELAGAQLDARTVAQDERTPAPPSTT